MACVVLCPGVMFCIRFSFLLVLLVVSACSIGTNPSRGELDNVGLSWQDGLGCLFGCDANGTIALGAAARFGVEDHEREPDLSVASPDGSALVTYNASTGTVVVTALEVGEIVVEFYRDGGLYDRVRGYVSYTHLTLPTTFPVRAQSCDRCTVT